MGVFSRIKLVTGCTIINNIVVHAKLSSNKHNFPFVKTENNAYRVSQKFVPLILRTIAFDQNFIFILEDVYFSIKYMYSEFQ